METKKNDAFKSENYNGQLGVIMLFQGTGLPAINGKEDGNGG